MSNTNYNKVREFMQTFGQAVKDDAEFVDDDVASLRIELISEELEELCEAVEKKDLAEIADALTDLLYVVYGAGAAYGIDLDATFDEVHESNMSKLGEDGKPIYREDGKILKGPNYWKPDLEKFL